MQFLFLSDEAIVRTVLSESLSENDSYPASLFILFELLFPQQIGDFVFLPYIKIGWFLKENTCLILQDAKLLSILGLYVS